MIAWRSDFEISKMTTEKGVFIMKVTASKIFREVAPIRRKMLYVSNGGIGKRPGRNCV